MTDEHLVVAYDPAWPQLFAELADRLRSRLGDVALRIDHIGPTAVSDLDAKPIIDVQVSLANLGPSTPTGPGSRAAASCGGQTTPS